MKMAKATYQVLGVITFEDKCKELQAVKHDKNFEAYKKAMLNGGMVRAVHKKSKKSWFSF